MNKRKIYLDKIIKVIKNDYPLFKNMKSYGFYDQLSNEEMDYVFSGVYEQPVKIEGYGYQTIGIGIYNENGYKIYWEDSDGTWVKREYDNNGNEIYSENSNGLWIKYEYDEKEYIIYSENSNGLWIKYEYDIDGNRIYFENSNGYWRKSEYDNNGNRIYFENSDGEIINNR